MYNALHMAAAAVLLYILLWFVASLVLKRNDVSDVAWGGGFIVAALAALVSCGAATDRAVLVIVLVIIWGLRLALHIGLWNRGKGEDARYLQAITIADQVYEAQIKSVDFIRRYIFPGGFIPSVAAITRSLAKVTDLRLFHLEDLTPHYARTLHVWRERFIANLDAVQKLGYPETFIRMWEYYLSYCEGAFKERYIGSVQMVLTKPDCRSTPILQMLQ
jgi:hypothetical protein